MSDLPEDEGGDPVCWIHLICPECGAMPEEPETESCPRCGTALEEPPE